MSFMLFSFPYTAPEGRPVSIGPASAEIAWLAATTPGCDFGAALTRAVRDDLGRGARAFSRAGTCKLANRAGVSGQGIGAGSVPSSSLP